MALKKKNVHKIIMPEQKAEIRKKNFSEVPIGYSKEMAQTEASRCLQCKKPPCIRGCPVGVDIPGFIKLIEKGNFSEAILKIWSQNTLPAVCGRVCPQEIQCEGQCILGKKGDSVAIGNLERFVADWALEHKINEKRKDVFKQNKKIAVVGSGPSGLTVAGDLIKKGYEVTVFEAFHKLGGVLVYGIPEFRLPKSIVAHEVNNLEKMGVTFRSNSVVGRTILLEELFQEGFDAIYLGLGAGLPRFMNIQGENLIGVLSANEYLTRANLMKAYKFPDVDTPIPIGKKVVVLGGGNVAMDSARTALRLGAQSVKIVYRRSEKEMPARKAEVHHAKEEGIEFELLTNPTKFLGNSKGKLIGTHCVKMRLGETDKSGRRQPMVVENSEFDIESDLAIVAIGSGANPLLTQTTPEIELNNWGYIRVTKTTGKTSKVGVWAGGDIVTGAATVILAMGAGREAANSIDKYLSWGW